MMMLRTRLRTTAQLTHRHCLLLAHEFSSSCTLLDSHTNIKEPIPLDPSLKSLLQDVDMSLMHNKHRSGEYRVPEQPKRELEPWPESEQDDDRLAFINDPETYTEHWEEDESRGPRKSPAALFGSQQIGAVELPHEFQDAIQTLITDADKPRLHEDAKRLFLSNDGSSKTWDTTYDAKYKSRLQQHRHAERDGTAFASIALPSHFSAIYAVLEHVKLRLGPQWKVDRVIDWAAGVGSGFWASAYAFQKTPTVPIPEHGDNYAIANSEIGTYIGMEKRESLTMIGKRLIGSVQGNDIKTTWRKSFNEEDKLAREEGKQTVALSAFALSSLPTPLARKTMVKEMWESGADVIVIIDHSTPAGFENIAEARQNLLRMGKKEFDDPEMLEEEIQGSHVVAPCPHDGACPLYQPGVSNKKLVCGFSQRMQRPAFIRHTKHSGVGHEDVGYSYVVVRRGKRPVYSAGQPLLGRVGAIGHDANRAQMEKEQRKAMRELEVHVEGEVVKSATVTSAAASVDELQSKVESRAAENQEEDLSEALRLESYAWPRLIFPPLKRSGHIILDVCAPSGKILRQTIPKSQGKQPFYDARKSSWGDLFPHAPKNKPQERHFGGTGFAGQDIGKRSGKKMGKSAMNAEEVARKVAAKMEKEAQEARKRMRRERKMMEKDAEERQI